ncbi:MAG: cytochrome c biogenesis protein ResB [Lentisphaeria bacterium]|nr:cytochrome c biogenesis protein ResB [Lentisphaeria bacterium]
MKKIFSFFSSLYLCIATLGYGMILIFFGTLAQIDMGIFAVKKQYFDTFFVYSVLPGGYTVGIILLINMILGFFTRIQWTLKKAGIIVVHSGLILMIVGSFATSFQQVECQMQISRGESRNFISDMRKTEIVLLSSHDDKTDNVISIPYEIFSKEKEFKFDDFPFEIKIKKFFPVAEILNPQFTVEKDLPRASTNGMGKRLHIMPTGDLYADEKTVAVIVELFNDGKSIGTWLLANILPSEQKILYKGKAYRIALRHTRYYLPWSLTLDTSRHDKYIGTDIPKNFSSVVTIDDPENPLMKDSPIDIMMNEPLRHGGLAFYQQQFLNEANTVIYMVVENPSWQIPYIACIIIALGMIFQFTISLNRYLKKRAKDDA